MQIIKIGLFLSVLFCFCIRHENRKTNVIDLLAKENGKIFNLSEIATDIDYIPLETTDSSLIDRIDFLKVKGKNIYIGNRSKVYCFSKTGRYLFKLDKNGRGPGEYEFLFDFDISIDNSILAVKSLSSILLYKQTGNGFIFMNEIFLLVSPSRISFTGELNNILLQYSNSDGMNPFCMELIDLNGKSLTKWPNYFKFTLIGSQSYSKNENTSYWLNNRLFIKELMNDTLFILSDGSFLKPYLIFDTKDKRLTAEARSNGNYFVNHIYDFFLVQKIFASGRYIYYTYNYNRLFVHAIYDRVSENKYIVPAKVFLRDDLGGGVNFDPQYCNDGIFYTWVEASSLKNYVAGKLFESLEVKNPEKKTKLKKLAASLTEYDNPVLISAKIK